MRSDVRRDGKNQEITSQHNIRIFASWTLLQWAYNLIYRGHAFVIIRNYVRSIK